MVTKVAIGAHAVTFYGKDLRATLTLTTNRTMKIDKVSSPE